MIALSKKTIIIASASLCGVLAITGLLISLPYIINPREGIDFNPDSLIKGTASTYDISETVSTSFGSYTPLQNDYTPKIKPTKIGDNLQNVDFQGLSVTPQMKAFLEQYGFVIVDEGYEDIYEIYNEELELPKFITTDLCLHAYHVLYDLSLRILEGEQFFFDFEIMLQALRDDQMLLNGTVSDPVVHDALKNNIAYLSVMLYLLNSTTNPIPVEVESLTLEELALIDVGERAPSAIFGYDEDYTQYTVRGHYTRNEILGNYFKAMMYAGRIGFLLQGPMGEPEIGIRLTRMALLLISSFNATAYSETVWDFWDRIYEPTVFYVGASDDLTAAEYYQIWQNQGAPEGDALASESTIEEFIEEAKTYRKPLINSMFIFDAFGHENVTQGFRLMGQRFIPDSYIFQQLVHNKVGGRLMPTALDVLSVFGSPRAAFYMKDEGLIYPDYDDQIDKLREEFGNLTEYDWTQNLYWSWLYTLFPLLKPASEGYPRFMLSDAWTDKAMMTTLGSWAELRHDTILYAKQSYTYETSMPEILKGYVEPYPEVYARLASLAGLMKTGLESRGLISEGPSGHGLQGKLDTLVTLMEGLVTLSIKELENDPLTEDDIWFVNMVARYIEEVASYPSPDDPWASEADGRMAIIADVHTDPNTGQVLEVGAGDPYSIYVVVQDHQGKLRLTKGATFSYYEFKHPMNDRLTDEGWHEMLDTNPPDLPEWIVNSLPILSISVIPAVFSRRED
ncbi:MAG: hypothetical protein HeimAB125_15610 [Candidatus Heimdallarchaeota archaeon AB_125]|nr:MAG: hypothetical protein HeimAB125_15610 [Candidatus Heimdallarchaeota archaeon AB_125]